jgi:hypothetical protein
MATGAPSRITWGFSGIAEARGWMSCMSFSSLGFYGSMESGSLACPGALDSLDWLWTSQW